MPTTTGYDFASAGGTVTITGFAPSGVACATGYTGSVSHAVCGSAGTAYSVSGCDTGGTFAGQVSDGTGDDHGRFAGRSGS